MALLRGVVHVASQACQNSGFPKQQHNDPNLFDKGYT